MQTLPKRGVDLEDIINWAPGARADAPGKAIENENIWFVEVVAKWTGDGF